MSPSFLRRERERGVNFQTRQTSLPPSLQPPPPPPAGLPSLRWPLQEEGEEEEEEGSSILHITIHQKAVAGRRRAIEVDPVTAAAAATTGS